MDTYDRDGLTFEVDDFGPETGEAVVLLHGFPQDRTAWDHVVPVLVDAGHRVLAPDQRGYSPAARPDDPAAYVLPELAADVIALLDAAGVERAHVVGHDWGGAVAWYLAARHADRLSRVTVLSTPHGSAMRAQGLLSAQGLRSSYMAAFQVPWVPETVLLAGGGAPLRAWLRSVGLTSTHADRYVARMREPGALTAALAWYRALPRTRRTPRPAGGTRPVAVPVTYVWGSRDPFFSRASAEATPARVSGPCRVVELDAGHWLPETRALDVAAAVLAG